jgi:hypothetical protein
VTVSFAPVRRRTTIPLALTLAVIALLVIPAAASAAPRKVPFGFFGTVLPPQMSNSLSVSDTAVEQQMALMASSGVESVRIVLSWNDLEPTQGDLRFAEVDRLVAASARHGVSVLAGVSQSPRWISAKPEGEFLRYPPLDPAPYAELMRQLVLRYGPNGAFWLQNPSVPKVPVRRWQLWNEQNTPWNWAQKRWPRGYVRLLKQAYRAIHAADPGATVVAGSLVGALTSPWAAMRMMYKAGAKGSFDEIAVHPFTNNRSVKTAIGQVTEIVRRVRAQMRRRGDARKPIILTEVTWTAASGKVPRRARIGFETTVKGQKQRMKAAFKRFVRERRRLRITQAYWYNWASEYNSKGPASVMSFRYSGLNRLRGGVFSTVSLLNIFSALARKYEGCPKSTNAGVCR